MKLLGYITTIDVNYVEPHIEIVETVSFEDINIDNINMTENKVRDNVMLKFNDWIEEYPENNSCNIFIPTDEDLEYFKNKMEREPDNKTYKHQYELLKDCIVIYRLSHDHTK